MKLFISADIEGCAGMAFSDEAHKDKEEYRQFKVEMTDEVIAACEAAHEAGADEIVVKDGHGDASNIDPLRMPPYATLIRGKSGHPANMMFGLDESFDGVLYIGYHAPAGDPNFILSHTSTGNSLHIKLNGAFMSEFMLNSYTAASYGVPVLFISGDQRICSLAKGQVPGITTVETKRGVGSSTFCVPASTVIQQISEGVRTAIGAASYDSCQVELPSSFVYEVTFKDWKKAYQMSFYPGMEAMDTFTLHMRSNKWMDILTAHSFVVY